MSGDDSSYPHQPPPTPCVPGHTFCAYNVPQRPYALFHPTLMRTQTYYMHVRCTPVFTLQNRRAPYIHTTVVNVRYFPTYNCFLFIQSRNYCVNRKKSPFPKKAVFLQTRRLTRGGVQNIQAVSTAREHGILLSNKFDFSSDSYFSFFRLVRFAHENRAIVRTLQRIRR